MPLALALRSRPAVSTQRRPMTMATKPAVPNVLGKRPNGPGTVTLSPRGELLLNGRQGTEARIEAARLVEGGLSPFAHATPVQRERLLKDLTQAVKSAPRGDSYEAVLERAATATMLLALARTSPAEVRTAAVETYVQAMGREPDFLSRSSMQENLAFDRLPLSKAQQAVMEKIQLENLPNTSPFGEWFGTSKHPKLEVRHYVMEDFWKVELAAHQKRGFRVESQTATSAVLKGVRKDPTGKSPDLTVHIKMKKTHENVLRDMDDPSVHMILYSGHAQLGAVVDQSVAMAPKIMRGTKWVQIFGCRAGQSEPAIRGKFRGVHLTTTRKSSYSEDDAKVLDQAFDMIARRDGYSSIKPRLKSKTLIQGEKNYDFPNDPRHLLNSDTDGDALKNSSALGPDRFYDPARRFARGGSHSFELVEQSPDPQKISGQKLDQGIGFYNTSLYYFAQENRAAPITFDKTDSLLSGGWFVSSKDEMSRITESKRDGKTWYKVALNSRLAPRSREVVTAVTVMESHLHLVKKDHGTVTEKDKLQGAMQVAEYLDQYVKTSTDVDTVLKGFTKHYGITGFSYEVYYKASQSVGGHGNPTAAVGALKKAGVRA